MTDKDIFIKFMEGVAQNADTIYDAHTTDDKAIQFTSIKVLACDWAIIQLQEKFKTELTENQLSYLAECASSFAYMCNFISGRSEKLRMEQRLKQAKEKGVLT